MPAWVIVVYALACARIVGLITLDEITRPLRDAILRRLREERRIHRSVAYLLTCPWCSSIYAAAAIAPIAWWWGTKPAAAVPATALAFSQISGMVSSVGRGD